MNENIYQEETQLPSKGLAYPEGMVPDGRVVYAMMGTQEEKILAGGNTRSNAMLTQILDRLIVEPKIKSADLITLDRMFLLLKIRIYSLGEDYRFEFVCPHCNQNSEIHVNLAEQNVKYFPDDWKEPIEVELPILKKTINLRMLRAYDEDEVEDWVRKLKAKNPRLEKEGDPSYIPLLAKAIYSTPEIPADSGFSAKVNFVQSLKSRDSLAITRKLKEMDFGVDMTTDISCPACSMDSSGVSIPLTPEFFRPEL